MVTWEAPGAGYWELDRSHVVGGATPLLRHIQMRSLPTGMRRVFAELGTPADTLDCAFVNGFFYTRLRPLIGADRPAKKLPPPLVLKAVSRLHPTFRRRTKAAVKLRAERPWRKVIADWENGGRTRVESRNLAFQKLDLGELDDVTLIAHTNDLLEHCCASWEHHFWLHGYDLGPIGMYLADCRSWGIEPAEAIPLLEGASPSTSEPTRIVARLRAAVEKSGRVPDDLDDVRAVSPEVAEDLDRYLEYRGAIMVTRYDLDGLTLAEMPGVVLSTILHGVDRTVGDGLQYRIEVIRSRVPVAHQEEFDERLEEARSAMNLRDDNGPTTAEWPLGLLRLGAPRGRTANGRPRASPIAPADALELTPEEITLDDSPAVDRRRTSSTIDATSSRARRTRRTDVLGEPEPAPPLDLLPKPLADLVQMVQIVIEQLGMGGERVTHGPRGCRRGRPHLSRPRLPGRLARAGPRSSAVRRDPGRAVHDARLQLGADARRCRRDRRWRAAQPRRRAGPRARHIRRRRGAGALNEIPDGALIDVDPIAGVVRIVAEA